MVVAVGAEDAAHFFEEGDGPAPALAPREGAFDGGGDLDDVEGLDQVVEHAVADALDGRFDRAAAGDDDDFGLRRFHSDRPHQLVALHAGHVQIDGDEIDLLGPEHVERFGSVFRGRHFVAPGKNHAKRLAWPALVVDDQDARPARARRERAAQGGRRSGVEVEAHAGLEKQALCRRGAMPAESPRDHRKSLVQLRKSEREEQCECARVQGSRAADPIGSGRPDLSEIHAKPRFRRDFSVVPNGTATPEGVRTRTGR